VRKADLVLLCIDDWPSSEAIINSLDNAVPGFPVITFNGHDSPELLPSARAMRWPKTSALAPSSWIAIFFRQIHEQNCSRT